MCTEIAVVTAPTTASRNQRRQPQGLKMANASNGPAKLTASVCLRVNTPMPATSIVNMAMPKRRVSTATRQSQKMSVAWQACRLSGWSISARKFLESTSQMRPQLARKRSFGRAMEVTDRMQLIAARAPKPEANIPKATLMSRQKRMSSSRPKGFKMAKHRYSRPGL